MFASTRFELDPDIMLVAKGISSGYTPVGAAIVAGRVWEPFWADGSDAVFRHGITYAGHASACAGALANLDILDREELVARVRSLESVLEAALRPLADHSLVKEVRAGVGLLGAVQLHDRWLVPRVTGEMIANGVLGRQLNDGAIHISPPFVITEDEIRGAADGIASALDVVAARSS